MKVAVVGAGAMGSVYAGLLGDAGNDVWAVDVWREHVDAIQKDGLRVEGASGDRVVRVGATSDPAEVGTVDLVVVATKAMDVETAAASARVLLAPETAVLSIQNGLGSADRVARVLGSERLIVGVAGGFGASIVGPGHARHEGWELVRLGEYRGPSGPRLERIAELWRGAGFRVRTYDEIEQPVWEKLICNVAFSGPCGVLGCTIGAVLDDPAAWQVASRCAVEAHDVARARGVRLDVDDPVEYVHGFGQAIRAARPSVLLDLLAGKPCEIDVLNGAIPPAAREAGLEAPVNETVAALVKAREAALLLA
jgi:2-dehydropantoate 2-reductase